VAAGPRHPTAALSGPIEVDPDRIGVWGTSFSAAHAFVGAAIDRRVKAISGQAPFISGRATYANLARVNNLVVGPDIFTADRRARAEGKPPVMIPVVDTDPSALVGLPTPDSYAYFTHARADLDPDWPNQVNLRRWCEPAAAHDEQLIRNAQQWAWWKRVKAAGARETWRMPEPYAGADSDVPLDRALDERDRPGDQAAYRMALKQIRNANYRDIDAWAHSGNEALGRADTVTGNSPTADRRRSAAIEEALGLQWREPASRERSPILCTTTKPKTSKADPVASPRSEHSTTR
jgi:hypothetical protein